MGAGHAGDSAGADVTDDGYWIASADSDAGATAAAECLGGDGGDGPGEHENERLRVVYNIDPRWAC